LRYAACANAFQLSTSKGREINHLTILFARKTIKSMIEIYKIEIPQAIGKHLFDDPIFL